MIYVVKCFYCEHEFKVKRGETGADMMCPECGKANSIRDVIKRIEDKKTSAGQAAFFLIIVILLILLAICAPIFLP